MNHKNSIGFYLFYFGQLPEWIHLLFKTFEKNNSIDFHLFTDCKIPKSIPNNLYIHKTSYDEYKEMIKEKLNITISSSNPIKLCDLRPFIGYLHHDVFKSYDFYGWIDLDLLLGDIRSFYTDELLSKYDVFSTHRIRIAGHMSLFRNTKKNREMYKKIYRWKESLENPQFVGLDEHGITNAYTLTIFDRINQKFNLNINNFITRYFSKKKKVKLYMKEQYTTPFTPIPWIDGSLNSEQPDTWFYKDGVISNSRDKNRSFIYLHFMNFKTDNWRHDKTPAPWKGMDKICFASIEDIRGGIIINKEGIFPINKYDTRK